MENNLFEKAARKKYRFPSIKGLLTVEDLWDLPLTSNTGVDLNTVAKTINNSLKAAQEENFVDTRPNKERALFENQLEVVKHIIAVKISDDERRKRRAEMLAEEQTLLAVLEKKGNEKLEGMSEKQIRDRIARLKKEALDDE